MHDTITFAHGLASFEVTADPKIVRSVADEKLTLTCGTISGKMPRVCPHCGGPMDIHQDHEVTLRHVPLQMRAHLLRVRRKRTRCRVCGHVEMQGIPFKDPGHRMTKHLRYMVEKRLGQGHTLKSVALEFGLHPAVVKDIDRQRLRHRFENRRPTSYSRHIAIDEFLLHKGHRYATVVLDLESGDILWCEEGKRKEQVYNFIEYMGKEWMGHVEAVAMDMNAQYDSAFAERCPWIAVVYDIFHLVKLYNDTVLTAMRRRKQRELDESGDRQGYRLYKGSRYIVISDRRKLREKDRRARENNRMLNEISMKGLKCPPGTRMMHADNERRLDELLAVNEDLSRAYFLLDQLKAAFKERDPKVLFVGLKRWLSLAEQSDAEEILKFAKTIRRRIRGLVNHATYPITNGKLEGTNNLVKTIRRQSYGFRDTQYFFWKIMEASRRPYLRYKSHRILC